MRLYQEDNPKDRLYGIIASCIAYILIAFLIVTISITAKSSDREDTLLAGGVMIDFGADMDGYGVDAPPQSKPQPQPQPEQVEEISNITESELTIEKPKEVVVEQKKEEPQTPAPPQVNKAALFPGMGSDEGKGDQKQSSGVTGSTDGTQGGSGIGGSTSGMGNASLAGRSLVGSLPSPTYNVNSGGRVVVEVRVNQNGVVENAIFKAEGSTTTNSSLVKSAIEAARKAKFNIDSDAPITQIGTITYNFLLE